MPGVGENQLRDEEYSTLYKNLLPELDAILWVLKADDRAYSIDIDFYVSVVKPHLKNGKPFIIALNQIDKVEPFREWDIVKHTPGSKQAKNIDIKISGVANNFQLKQSLIIAVSAEEKYGLTKLVDELIFSLPDEKKISIAREVPKENLSEKAKKEVKESTSRVVGRVIAGVTTGAAIGAKVAGPVGAIVGGIVGGIGGFFSLW